MYLTTILIDSHLITIRASKHGRFNQFGILPV